MSKKKKNKFKPGFVAFVKEEISGIARNEEGGSEYFYDLYPLDEVDILRSEDSQGRVLVNIEGKGQDLIHQDKLKPVSHREKDREALKKELGIDD